MYKMYKAVYEDDNFEIFDSDNDSNAISTAEEFEEEHGIVFNIFEINENYEEIRTIY